MKTTVNTAGLSLTVLGAALLFFFGVGGGPEKGGPQALILEQSDPVEEAAYERNAITSKVGFALIVVGSGLQIWSNYIAN